VGGPSVLLGMGQCVDNAVRCSGTDSGERARCQVVNACPGRVHIRQVGRASSYHSHRRRTALSRYVSL